MKGLTVGPPIRLALQSGLVNAIKADDAELTLILAATGIVDLEGEVGPKSVI